MWAQHAERESAVLKLHIASHTEAPGSPVQTAQRRTSLSPCELCTGAPTQRLRGLVWELLVPVDLGTGMAGGEIRVQSCVLS